MRWTSNDKKRVRAILDRITASTSQAEFARSLGENKSRATVNNWRRRGRVPLEHIPAVISAAGECGQTVTAGQLHPDARLIEQQLHKATSRGTA